ncbi:recombinational DNA repair protein [Paracoccus phage vB_PmaP_KLEP18-1]|nr:recombinational DNA repair protein [Paracoccus phage vB_PmaP_KLEP18-1]
MTQLPATTEPRQITLRDRIERAGPEFRKALPGHIPVDKFVRTVQTAITMNPEIARACESREGMQSLMVACTKAATDGLIIDGREAALVTFKGAVTYMPMVAGIMKMARNSGDIASISAHVVYENDEFTYVLGDDERIEHAPKFGDRGAPVAVYAIVKMKDGTVQREVMDKDQVLRIGAQGRNSAQYDPKTGRNYGEWWRKTVIRRISKYLPRSSDRDDFQRAVERIDEDYDYDATDSETVPAAPTKKRGAAAAILDMQSIEGEATDVPSDAPADPETPKVEDEI